MVSHYQKLRSSQYPAETTMDADYTNDLVLLVLYSHIIHIHLHICRCMQNRNDDTIKTNDTVLQKNIPLTLFKRVVCERELETEQNCNILTPLLLAITAFLSRSPGPSSLLGAVFSTASFLQL